MPFACTSRARLQNVSCAVLLIDAISALDSVIPVVAMCPDSGVEHTVDLCKRSGQYEEAFREFIQHLRNSAFDEAGTEEHVINMVGEAFNATCFSTPGGLRAQAPLPWARSLGACWAIYYLIS